MSIPVAMIPYTNMAPYRQLGPPDGCRFVPLVPRASIDALLTGNVAAAAVPVGGLTRLENRVETVGQFGIAAKGHAMSVLFFSRVPFDRMHGPRTIRVTSESASSVRLLYLLLGQTLGFDRLPHLAADSNKADGELMIGDRALIKGLLTTADDQFPIVTDLSEKWYQIHGLPFVFARWVVRNDAPASVKTTIARWLDKFREKEYELVEQAIPESARTLDVHLDIVRRYFQAIRRCLDENDIKGQRRFFKELDRFGRVPLFQYAANETSPGYREL